MNTVAHLVFNLVTLEQPTRVYRWPKFLTQKERSLRQLAWPMILGSIIPDFPMVIFYLVEKYIFGQPESYIWTTAYFSEGWSNFIDLFNSIPLIFLGFALCFWKQWRWGWIVLSGMFLHVLGDLPLHHDDGHHHFFPLSGWRFDSPVSYWDIDHHGGIMAVLEAIAVLVACLYLFRVYRSRWAKGAMALCLLLDTVVLVWAISRLS